MCLRGFYFSLNFGASFPTNPKGIPNTHTIKNGILIVRRLVESSNGIQGTDDSYKNLIIEIEVLVARASLNVMQYHWQI